MLPEWILHKVPKVNADFAQIREAIASGSDYTPPILAILCEHGVPSGYFDLDENRWIKTTAAIALFVRSGYAILEEWHCTRDIQDEPFDFDWQVSIYNPDAESKYDWRIREIQEEANDLR